MNGILTIKFSTDNIVAVSDLKAAILLVAPHMVDNVSIIEGGAEDVVQWVIDNFDDLQHKHRRPHLTLNRVGVARLVKDEHPEMGLKEIIDLIAKKGY